MTREEIIKAYLHNGQGYDESVISDDSLEFFNVSDNTKHKLNIQDLYAPGFKVSFFGTNTPNWRLFDDHDMGNSDFCREELPKILQNPEQDTWKCVEFSIDDIFAKDCHVFKIYWVRNDPVIFEAADFAWESEWTQENCGFAFVDAEQYRLILELENRAYVVESHGMQDLVSVVIITEIVSAQKTRTFTRWFCDAIDRNDRCWRVHTFKPVS